MRHSRLTAAAALAAFGLSTLPAAPAGAAYLVTMAEISGNVVASGSGSFDLTGLSLVFDNFPHATVQPSFSRLILGPTSNTYAWNYDGVSGPVAFGDNIVGRAADGGSGAIVGIIGRIRDITVPAGYVSGTDLGISTATWTGATFASLGVTPGIYVWSWGSGANADNFTLRIGEVVEVPEPGALALLSAGLLGLVATRRVRRRDAG